MSNVSCCCCFSILYWSETCEHSSSVFSHLRCSPWNGTLQTAMTTWWFSLYQFCSLRLFIWFFCILESTMFQEVYVNPSVLCYTIMILVTILHSYKFYSKNPWYPICKPQIYDFSNPFFFLFFSSMLTCYFFFVRIWKPFTQLTVNKTELLISYHKISIHTNKSIQFSKDCLA